MQTAQAAGMAAYSCISGGVPLAAGHACLPAAVHTAAWSGSPLSSAAAAYASGCEQLTAGSMAAAASGMLPAAEAQRSQACLPLAWHQLELLQRQQHVQEQQGAVPPQQLVELQPPAQLPPPLPATQLQRYVLPTQLPPRQQQQQPSLHVEAAQLGSSASCSSSQSRAGLGPAQLSALQSVALSLLLDWKEAWQALNRGVSSHDAACAKCCRLSCFAYGPLGSHPNCL